MRSVLIIQRFEHFHTMILSERRLLQPFIALCALISLVQSYPMLAEVPEETQQVRFASRGTFVGARAAPNSIILSHLASFF